MRCLCRRPPPSLATVRSLSYRVKCKTKNNNDNIFLMYDLLPVLWQSQLSCNRSRVAATLNTYHSFDSLSFTLSHILHASARHQSLVPNYMYSSPMQMDHLNGAWLASTCDVIPTLVRATGANHRRWSPTSRHAANHVKRRKNAKVSRSSAAGGAVTSTLNASARSL